MMKNIGVLILVHQGFSFCTEIHEKLNELGVETYILTSQYDEFAPLTKIERSVAWLSKLEGKSLTQEAVLSSLEKLQNEGKKVVASIATFEGYRVFCAEVNKHVHAADCDPENIILAMDKYRCRKKLFESGYSQVRASILTKDILEKAKQSGEKKFIKPRRGGASFGAFALKPNVVYQDIVTLQEEIKQDDFMRSVFYDQYDFLLEDQIDGDEYCLEVIAWNDKAQVVVCHGKDISEGYMTILENQLFCPAHLSLQEIEDASQHINRCLNTLNLQQGCFHIELRKSSWGWEVIEINPRVGGVFVNDSVKIRTHGESMLDLWLYVLLSRVPELQTWKNLEKAQSFFEKNTYGKYIANSFSTFQQIFLGTPGKMVKKIKENKLFIEPYKKFLDVKEGDIIPNSKREHFIGYALWKFPHDKHFEIVKKLRRESHKLYEFEYADFSTVSELTP